MKMHNPPHPGEILREDIIPYTEWTVQSLAMFLEISDPELEDILAGKAPITFPIANLLGKLAYGSSRLWLDLQQDWEEAQ